MNILRDLKAKSFLKTSHSAVKESEIKTSTGHFRKLATQKSEKSDDLVKMPVPCSDTEHRNDSKPCQNDHHTCLVSNGLALLLNFQSFITFAFADPCELESLSLTHFVVSMTTE
jgi:hypothetical protein